MATAGTVKVNFKVLDPQNQLNEPEREVVERAANTFVTTGTGIAPFVSGLFMAQGFMSKKNLRGIAIRGFFGFVTGSALASSYAAYSAIRVVKASPYEENITKVIINARKRSAERNHGVECPPFPMTRGPPRGIVRDEPSPSNDPHPYDAVMSDATASDFPEPGSGASHADKLAHQSTRWDELRKTTTKSQTRWDDIRKDTRDKSPNSYEHINPGDSNSDPNMGSGDFDEAGMPRTREAVEAQTRTGSVRTNKYGDPIE
ncbi:hypothetical protein H4R33_001008 [Dimargaris cristalligena]|uniref:Uncharacterized protein n=1 Tax=Dimargaris cristalligena TaxID=215637 RepID=A0A4V1J4U3_9FUNG|nr:hypothetical protein H4R33_001008 [Dimargaris cristalligena]RKP36759.1 hypothetical protein BJ085DRAFT_38336 [Dimargaris cristalligena]|eukprot:RKP36759.1 hypothetical protein BJ085DRAFT_38336 [Dimargaris cristalligena]